MLSIPIVFGVQGDGEVRAALDDLEKGIQSARTELIKLNNQKVLVDYKFSVNGKEIRQEFRGIAAETKRMNDEKKKAFGGEAGSIARQKKYIQQLKKEREELKANTRAYNRRSAAIKQAQATLRQMQGIEEGSVTRLKELRAGLIAQRDAVEINSPAFQKLTKRIQVFDRQLAKSRKTSINFTKVLGKFAVASAGIQAVAGALRSVGNAVDVYQRRTKQIEGFNLALENIGVSQAETSRIFMQAASTAKSLGAPLQQVEKTYRRMIPALKSVGASAAESDKFIEAVSARTQTLGLNTEQSSRLLEAFAQVLSKGKLQAEELNQQISELDGGFRVQLAQALRVTTAELNNMIKNSEVTADVFVKAVNRMSNGAELLKLRTAEGAQTIQQLQNTIATLDTENIGTIGKAIEPGIRAFLRIRQALAEFVAEFTQTEAFKGLVIVFNSVAKGVEIFTKNLLIAIQAATKFLDPILSLANAVLGLGDEFGGLVGILTQVVLMLGTAKIAALALAKALALKAVIAGLTKAVAGGGIALGGFAVAAAKVAIPLAIAAAGLKLFTTAMREGKKQGLVFTEGLKEVSEQLKAIGAEAEVAANSFEGIFRSVAAATGLTESAIVDDIAVQMLHLERITATVEKRFKQLGVDIMDVNSIMKLSEDEIENQIAVQENLKTKIDERITQLKSLIDAREKDNRGNDYATRAMKEQLEVLLNETAEREVYIKQLKRGEKARRDDAEATGQQIEKLEDLKKATEKALTSIEVDQIKASTKALKQFGRAAKDAGLLAAANLGIEADASQKRLAAYRKEIQALQQNRDVKGALSKEEEQQYIKLTKLIGQETQKQVQLGIDARNAVIDAFEEGIRDAQSKVDILSNAASGLKSSFDGVANTFVGGLSAATGLINQIVATEIQGLEKGSAKRVAIIQAQLKAQALANEAEDRIARLRLDTQSKIAISEARISQLRFQAEAKIAQARGQSDVAAAFREAAQLQDVVIRGLQKQFEIEKSVLDIEKQSKAQKLITAGLDEKIASSRQAVAQQLGVQDTSLKKSLGSLNQLVQKSRNYATNLSTAATEAQNSAEELEVTSLQEGVKNARGIAANLGNAEGAGAGLNSVMNAAQGAFQNVEGSSERMVGYLKEGVTQASKLSNLVAGGGNARALGGPVTGGQQYTVNDGGGREGFLSNAGKFSMLPAARNMQWTAPTSGTVIPANMVGDFLSAQSSDRINKASGGASPRVMNSGFESGNLIKQMTSAMSAAGSNQRITNNVTIQSEKPVQDASKIMANVARMRLRNSRRI